MPRQLFLRLSVLLCLVAGLSCSRAPVPTSVGPPMIHFSSPEIDLGEIEFAPDGREIEFPLENRGMQPLRIKGTVSSCGCAVARVDRTELAPEETSRIIAVISPRQSEERSAMITVYSNDPARPKAMLRLKWKAIAPLDLDPPSIELGIVRPGTNPSASVNLVWRSASAKCVIKAIECYPLEEVHAEIGDGPRKTNDLPTQTLRLTVAPKREPGLRNGRVTLRLDGCWQDEIVLPISWRVQDVIEASPERVFLGIGVAEASCEKCCKLMSTAGPIVIESIELAQPDSAIDVQIHSMDASDAEIMIRWTLPQAPGLHSATLRVNVTEPERRQLEIPVSIFVKSTSERS